MNAINPDISHAQLKAMLTYDPETGIVVWRINPGNGSKAGEVAGSVRKDGYALMTVCGRHVLVHRVAWFYMTGEWPPDKVDHKDTNRSNNRWKNLRSANGNQNKANGFKYKSNTSGLKGVSWHSQCEKWNARIGINGHVKSLGVFDCRAAAGFAYQIAADKHFGEFARST